MRARRRRRSSSGSLIYAAVPGAPRAASSCPGVAWFAFIGLAVPAALVERLPFRAALARGRELGRADYVHAFGSLAALVLVVGIAEQHARSCSSTRRATTATAARSLLADVVLSPLLYIGGAMLYHDQAARVGSRPTGARCRPTSSSRP